MAAVDVQTPARATYQIRVDGNIFPRQSRGKNVDAVAEPTAQQSLIDSIWQRLPFADADCVGKQELIEGYAASVETLQRYYGDLKALIRSACRTNLTVMYDAAPRVDLMQQEIDNCLNATVEHADLQPLIIDNAVNAHLAAKPTEAVQVQLTRSLRKLTAQLAAQVFRTLDRLTDRQVTGVIEWTGETTCKFHFFTESLRQTYECHSVAVSDESEFTSYGELITRRTTYQHHGSHVRKRARHEHHLIDARRHPVSDPALVVPEQYRPVIVAIPEWLRPVARIVAGKQICEYVIEQEMRRSSWLQEQVVVSRSVRIQPDPAIVIDRYVLTGWGEKEIAAARRLKAPLLTRLITDEVSPRRTTALHISVVLAVLLQFIGLALTIGGTARSAGFLAMGLLMALLGMAPAGYALILQWVERKGKLSRSDHEDISLIVSTVAAALLAIHLFLAAWQISYGKLALIGVLATVTGALTGTVLCRRRLRKGGNHG